MNKTSEFELLESELAEELEAVRDALNGTRLCEHHGCEKRGGRQSCEDACDEYENLANTLDRTFIRLREMLKVAI